MGARRAEYCSFLCKYPSHECAFIGCSGIANKSNYCSIRCRNRHIGLLSRDKNREAQNRPEVRAKKSIRQKLAFENPETREKHRNSIKAQYDNGRKPWNLGLNKNNDERVKNNADMTSKAVQSIWDNGGYKEAIEKGSFKKTESQIAARSKLMSEGLAFEIVKEKYGLGSLGDDEAKESIENTIRGEFLSEGYVVTRLEGYQTKSYVYYTCDKGHKSRILLNSWRSGFRCKMCGHILSKAENEIFEYCRSLNEETVQSARPQWLEGKEIDVYLEEKGFGIEYCGLYWHSGQFVKRDKHRQKFIKCKENGVKLFTIFSDEWEEKKDLIKAMIKYRLGAGGGKVVRAGKCEIVELNVEDERLFLEKFHIGGHANSRHKIGLSLDGELVSILTFRKPYAAKDENAIEICRFAINYNYVVYGAFSKLLKAFIEKYSNLYDRIVSYSDCRFGYGDVYEKNGFKFLNHTEPNYWYTDGKTREFRFKHRKNNKLLDLGGTEKDQNIAQNLFPIYDCGHYKWIMPTIKP